MQDVVSLDLAPYHQLTVGVGHGEVDPDLASQRQGLAHLDEDPAGGDVAGDALAPAEGGALPPPREGLVEALVLALPDPRVERVGADGRLGFAGGRPWDRLTGR